MPQCPAFSNPTHKTKGQTMNIINSIKTLVSAIQNGFPVLFKGSPGIGKSDAVAQAASEAKMPIIIRHPVIEESIDYKGLPGFEGGKAKFFAFADFHEMLTASAPLVVFFDDLGQAPVSVQAALMQVILAREIGGKKISPHVRFVAATNSRKDNAGVTGLITPLVSRFTVLEMETDSASWIQWGLKNGMPLELLAFMRFRPDMISTFNPATAKDLNPYACPRSIAQLGKWLNAGCLSFDVWKGSVGEAFAVEFKGFFDTYKALAGLPDKVIANPGNAPVPDKPAVMYALTAALAHRATDVSFPSIAAYGKRLSDLGKAEFETCLIQDTITRHPELTESRPFIDWSVRNQNVI
jgi:hypothetical protein